MYLPFYDLYNTTRRRNNTFNVDILLYTIISRYVIMQEAKKILGIAIRVARKKKRIT